MACNQGGESEQASATDAQDLGNGNSFKGSVLLDLAGSYNLPFREQNYRIQNLNCQDSYTNLENPIIEGQVLHDGEYILRGRRECGESLETSLDDFLFTRIHIPLIGSDGGMLVGEDSEGNIYIDYSHWCQLVIDTPDRAGYKNYYDLIFNSNEQTVAFTVAENIPESNGSGAFGQMPDRPSSDFGDIDDTPDQQADNSSGGSVLNISAGSGTSQALGSNQSIEMTDEDLESYYWVKSIPYSQSANIYETSDFHLEISETRNAKGNFTGTANFFLSHDSIVSPLLRNRVHALECFFVER